MDYRHQILNNLLDKYESSTHFYGTSQINRRVSLSFTRKTMPVYFAGDRPLVKNAIHQAVNELQSCGILLVDWHQGEKGNLLKRVSLNLEGLDAAYTLLKRVPKADQLRQCAKLLEETNLKTPWLSEAINFAAATLLTKRTLPAPFPIDPSELQIFLRTLSGLDQKGAIDIPERIFSIRYLGNSKLLAGKTRAALITLARTHRYLDPEFSDEDILAELGIVRTSAELLLAGPITIVTEGQTADLTFLSFGAVIDTHQAARAAITALHTDTILLVENKTNFHELVRQGVTKRMLLIYLGGFPGPGKRRFLTALGSAASTTSTKIYHWGDIDYGGFRIYRILQETAFPELKPLFMDETTLLKYRHMAEPLKPAYKKKLTQLLQDPRYKQFHSVLTQMLSKNLRLEQEAILADSTFVLPV